MNVTNDMIIRGHKVENDLINVTIGGRPLPHKVHHSPTGFNWGYGGSGPADLALSILDVCIGSGAQTPIFEGHVGRTAYFLHQEFKQKYVARWDDDWQITVGEVRKWVAEQAKKREMEYQEE